MDFQETRSWIGKVVSVAIVAQITLVMLIPRVEPEYELFVLEVTIMGSVLGIDILRQRMDRNIKFIQRVIDLFKDDDSSS